MSEQKTEEEITRMLEKTDSEKTGEISFTELCHVIAAENSKVTKSNISIVLDDIMYISKVFQ